MTEPLLEERESTTLVWAVIFKSATAGSVWKCMRDN